MPLEAASRVDPRANDNASECDLERSVGLNGQHQENMAFGFSCHKHLDGPANSLEVAAHKELVFNATCKVEMANMLGPAMALSTRSLVSLKLS